MRFVFFYTIIAFLLSENNYAQMCPNINPDIHFIQAKDTSKLFIDVANVNYFKNNEYFSPIANGYTLIGYFLTPQLVYVPSKRLQLEAGLHLQKYSGVEKYSKILPTYSLQLQLSPSVQVVFGTLYGNYQHKMPEPLFSYERFFTNSIENGLQFLINTENLHSDIWVDWEQFIFEEDTLQEHFTFGLSSHYSVYKKENGWELKIPFQIIANHRGGQINKSNKNVETLVNLASGLESSIHFNRHLLRSIDLRTNIFLFKNNSLTPETLYKRGFAIYPNMAVKTKRIFLHFGYWQGEKFYAQKGEPLFWSISKKEPTLSEPSRKLFTLKAFYKKKMFKHIYLGTGFESYYDLINKKNDYSFGIFLAFDEKFLVKQF